MPKPRRLRVAQISEADTDWLPVTWMTRINWDKTSAAAMERDRPMSRA